MIQPIGLGYGHQQYGNADIIMQQLWNQNQTTIDQINSMTSDLKSLQNEKKKNETVINELKKQHKDAKHERDKAKIDLEIREDKARVVETTDDWNDEQIKWRIQTKSIITSTSK